MTSPGPHRRPLLGVTAIGALLAIPLLLGSVRISGNVIVPEGDIVAEDLYAFGERVVIDGTIDGDLIVITGDLVVRGEVRGDVMGLVGGPARITGVVRGSVRVAAVSLDVVGSVDDDVAAVAVESTVRGPVGRDVLFVSGEIVVFGPVGRDVRGQALRMTVGGEVDRSVVVRVDDLTLGPRSRVGGDVVYEASAEARLAEGATVGGQLIRREALTPVWTRAVTRAFGVLSLLGFIVAGIVGQWVFRGTSQRATATAAERPGRSALVGAGLLVGPPVLALPLFLTLVGIPVALVVLLAWVVALFLGPLPAVTAFGGRLLRSRGGAAAALLVGAVALRGAMWLLPLLAAFIYLGALLIGLGSFGMAAWGLRREHAPS
jgi:hypothetical protein